jgi:hypothetical protein
MVILAIQFGELVHRPKKGPIPLDRLPGGQAVEQVLLGLCGGRESPFVNNLAVTVYKELRWWTEQVPQSCPFIRPNILTWNQLRFETS